VSGATGWRTPGRSTTACPASATVRPPAATHTNAKAVIERMVGLQAGQGECTRSRAMLRWRWVSVKPQEIGTPIGERRIIDSVRRTSIASIAVLSGRQAVERFYRYHIGVQTVCALAVVASLAFAAAAQGEKG